MRGLDDVQGLDVRSLRLKSDLSEIRVRLKGAWYPPRLERTSDVLGSSFCAARPAGVRPPHAMRLAAGPDARINEHNPHNFIQAGRADGAPGGTGHPVGGRTVCTGCEASTHRFRNTALKSVHEVRSMPGKVCTKCPAAQKKLAQSFLGSTKSVHQVQPSQKSVHKVRHERTFCTLCTLMHTLGISVLRKTRR